MTRHWTQETAQREKARGERREPLFSPFVDRLAASKNSDDLKLTLLRLDGGLDGREGGVGAELERERAVCRENGKVFERGIGERW